MPCYKRASVPSGGTVVSGPYTTEADCLNACKEGACCEGTSCSVKPQCQCQGAGQVFYGIGTTCDSIKGACCEYATTESLPTCSIKTRCECSGTLKYFRGVGTNCTTAPCLPVLDTCVSGYQCVVTSRYMRTSVVISTPALTYYRIDRSNSLQSCSEPFLIQPASGSFEFDSPLWGGGPGYVPYPFRVGDGNRPTGGWRNSSIYTSALPNFSALTAIPIGTGIRDFFFAVYASGAFATPSAVVSTPCDINIIGSFSLLMTPGTGVLTNTDAIDGTVYNGLANPTCAENLQFPWRVGVYFSAIARKYDPTKYNCVSGVFDIYHLDLVANGGLLPPVVDRNYVPNGPKIGTITMSEPI